MLRWFHIQLLKKERETGAEGHRERKLFQGNFLMEAILQENYNFQRICIGASNSFPSSLRGGEAADGETKIHPVPKQCSHSATQGGERFL